jgi:hypothetical protein
MTYILLITSKNTLLTKIIILGVKRFFSRIVSLMKGKVISYQEETAGDGKRVF